MIVCDFFKNDAEIVLKIFALTSEMKILMKVVLTSKTSQVQRKPAIASKVEWIHPILDPSDPFDNFLQSFRNKIN